MYPDTLLSHRQVVCGRQSFLFRPVQGIGLHLKTEQVADNGGDDLIGGYRPVTAHGVAAHGECSWRSNVSLTIGTKREIVLDSQDKEALLLLLSHVIHHGSRRNIPAAKTCRAGIDDRRPFDAR